jgi:DNA-binding transcriptional MerR regulator
MDMINKIVYSINEVSRLTEVPTHTIRFWERDFEKYLRPAKTLGGQRRYCARHIEIIKKIKHLRYQDKYTIAGTLKEMDRYSSGPLKSAEIDIGSAVEEGDITGKSACV